MKTCWSEEVDKILGEADASAGYSAPLLRVHTHVTSPFLSSLDKPPVGVTSRPEVAQHRLPRYRGRAVFPDVGPERNLLDKRLLGEVCV